MARFLLLFVVMVTVTAAGQDCAQTVPVGVIEGDTGAAISPLTLDMLQAKMGNTPLPITALDRVRTRRIIVLVDASGSMGEYADRAFSYPGPALRAIKQALGDLMGELPFGVSVEYGLFNIKSVFSDGFLSNPQELRKNMDEVTARFGKIGFGKTMLFDSLHEALLRFGTPQPGDSILLLTDGGDNRSKLTARKLEHEFHSASTRLITLLLVGREFQPDGVDQLQDLVANTGGSSLLIDTTSLSWSDDKHASQNLQMLRRFWNEKAVAGYLAQVRVPDTFKEDKKWTLSLNRKADPRFRHAAVTYPDHLGPCPVTTATAH